jgi:hypothetical protein
VVTTYSATLIRNMGYDPKQAALMNMPSGAVSIFFTLLVGYGVRKQSHRWAWIIACLLPAYVRAKTPIDKTLVQPLTAG